MVILLLLSKALLDAGSLCLVNTTIDRFHSILLLWQLEGKGSCDVDIDQSAGSMVT